MPEFPGLEMISVGPTFFILKATGRCNLDCGYCFTRQHFSGSFVSDLVIERSFREIDSLGLKSADVSWHGGEPLLLGIGAFRKGLTVQRQLKTRFRNHIQTNGLLLNDEWADLFAEFDFGVGLSLYGCQEVHDFNRSLPGGKGFHQRVMRGLSILQSHDIKPGVISVIGNHTEPQSYFGFIKASGVAGFNIKAVSGSWCGATALEEFTEFSNKVFKLWVQNDDSSLLCRQYMGYEENMIGGKTSLCYQSGRCSTVMTIDTDGHVYACDGLMGPDPPFGDIVRDGLAQILKSDKRQAFLSDLSLSRERCEKTCPDYGICQGGCTQEKSNFGDEIYCQSMRFTIPGVKT